MDSIEENNQAYFKVLIILVQNQVKEKTAKKQKKNSHMTSNL